MKKENTIGGVTGDDTAPDNQSHADTSEELIGMTEEAATTPSESAGAAEDKAAADGAIVGFGEGENGGRVIKLKNGKEVVVPAPKESRLRSILVMAAYVVLAAVLRGIGTYCFISPNGFAVGGIAGAAVILEYITGINLGYFNIAMNVPLLILAFFFLSKRYFFATASYTVLYSLVTIAIEQLNKIAEGAGGTLLYKAGAGEKIIAAVFGGVMCGLAFCIMVRAGGSQGGTDTIAAIIQKKRPDLGMAWLIFMIDSSIILLSFFVYDKTLTPVFLAIIESFSSSAVSDKFIKGSRSALKVEIITNHCNEICAEIFDVLGKGVTVVDAVGQYTGNSHKLLICVIKRRQIGDFERILKKYPDTFSYVVSANEVYGYWKK